MSAPELSVIIPAYNEEGYIGPCLDALLKQENDIHEVIVVDNNSSDRTAEIVRAKQEAHPKLRIISEPNAGVAFARNSGFNSASGDVLGRLDADSRVYPGWASVVRGYFEKDEAGEVGGISGLNNSYDSPFRRLKGWYVRKQIERGAFGGEREIENLHGANMAIRRSVWQRVRAEVSTEHDVHEDVDLALCMVAEDIKIRQLDDMMVDISPRRALTPPWEFTQYIRSGVKTFDMHGRLTPQISKALKQHWKFHILLWLLHLPYDPRRGRYSLRYLVWERPRARRLPIDQR